jgi:hypothetical protein
MQRFFTTGKGLSQGLGGTKLATLTASVRTAHLDLMDVALEWKDAPARELHKSDWIGAFDRRLLTEFHAPVKFRYVFPEHAQFPLATSGTMNFTVWNLRSSYVFIYVSGNVQYPAVIAQTEAISFDSSTHPMAHHVAISPTKPNTMLVMWTQAAESSNVRAPLLKWGLSPSKLENRVPATMGTYTQDDFCDTDTSAASRQGWFEPGNFLTAEIPFEHGKTYYYAHDDVTNETLNHVRHFTAPPSAEGGSTRLVLFGDMGNAPEDGSMHHSWDFGNHGELPSRNTSRLAAHLLDKSQAHGVVHFGDISYAVGYLSEWDEFMLQIEPVASRIPWMASIGNHEMGWTQSDPYNGTLETATDSGGECGVAFLHRFPFAMQSLGPQTPWRQASPWYSFDIGAVHFTMISSEHDIRMGSPQWKWMVADLQGVQRSATPWLAVTCHRPMYISSDYDGDHAIGTLLRDNVEQAMLDNGVDFFFTGHHHSYQRFCKLNSGTCVDDEPDKHGVYHVLAGMAGYAHSKVGKDRSGTAQFLDDTHWGVTYWEFNRTAAVMKFLDGATEEVVDQFTYHKPAAKVEPALVI